MPDISRISFVWNADFSVASGVRALKEAVEGHHSCTLCEIAYHRVRQTSDWKRHKSELAQRFGADIREPCRNQLKAAENAVLKGDYPAVLCHRQGEIIKLLGSAEINACDGEFAAFERQLSAALAALT